MFLQGNLQAVFDALYSMGVIDPILQKDWKEAYDNTIFSSETMTEAVHHINSCRGDTNKIVEILRTYDNETVECIAMEVAREFADFYARKDVH